MEGANFRKLESIPSDLVCNATDLIFSDKTIGKFEDGNHDEVMFVVENGLIKGVVHIVDYNNPNLYVELYRMLLKFENNLRTILIRNDFRNSDVTDWFKKMSEIASDERNRNFYKKRFEELVFAPNIERINYSNPFQTFYLRELTEFAIHNGLLKQKEVNPQKVGKLRNWIAHSKDATSVNPSDQHPVYNMKGLKIFINLVCTFFNSYDLLEMKLEETEKRFRLQ